MLGYSTFGERGNPYGDPRSSVNPRRVPTPLTSNDINVEQWTGLVTVMVPVRNLMEARAAAAKLGQGLPDHIGRFIGQDLPIQVGQPVFTPVEAFRNEGTVIRQDPVPEGYAGFSNFTGLYVPKTLFKTQAAFERNYRLAGHAKINHAFNPQAAKNSDFVSLVSKGGFSIPYNAQEPAVPGDILIYQLPKIDPMENARQVAKTTYKSSGPKEGIPILVPLDPSTITGVVESEMQSFMNMDASEKRNFLAKANMPTEFNNLEEGPQILLMEMDKYVKIAMTSLAFFAQSGLVTLNIPDNANNWRQIASDLNKFKVNELQTKSFVFEAGGIASKDAGDKNALNLLMTDQLQRLAALLGYFPDAGMPSAPEYKTQLAMTLCTGLMSQEQRRSNVGTFVFQAGQYAVENEFVRKMKTMQINFAKGSHLVYLSHLLLLSSRVAGRVSNHAQPGHIVDVVAS